MPQKPVIVRALYDYNRQHTDELSFKKGDVLTVEQQLEGGWWEGSFNGIVGWFPSNYVTFAAVSTDEEVNLKTDEGLLIHLQSFQKEIIQHILEGELRQVNELSQLLSIFLIPLEPLIHLSFLHKLFHLRDLLSQAIKTHKHLASVLSELKCIQGPKRVGLLFLRFAPEINAIGCDYSKIYLHVITGLKEHIIEVTRHMASFSVSFQMSHCEQQLALVFERLGRYPLLLKEMERYLEESHIDRADILNAIHVYAEISERCAILRKFKEYDIDLLLSKINGWQGKPIQELGDPILTLHILLVSIQTYESQVFPDFICTDAIRKKSQYSVLVIFPTCVVLLLRTNLFNVYDYATKIPLNLLAVNSSTESETSFDLLVKDSNSTNVDFIPSCKISFDCAGHNARDLLVSTLTDLCRRNSKYPVDPVNLSDQIRTGKLTNWSWNEYLPQDEWCTTSNVVENQNFQSHYHHRDTHPHHQSEMMMTTTMMEESLNSKLSNTTENLSNQQNSLKGIAKISLANNNQDDIVDIVNTTITTTNDNISNNEKLRLSSLKRNKVSRPLTEPPGNSISIEQLNIESERHQQKQQSSSIVPKLITDACHSKQISLGLAGYCEVPVSDVLITSSSLKLRFLPHKIITDAHIRWFEKDTSAMDKQLKQLSTDPSVTVPNRNKEETTVSSSSNSALTHAIRYLRIDGPLDFFHPSDRTGSVNGLNSIGLSSAANCDNTTSGASVDNRVRPQSPKMVESAKESRRKRGGTLQLLCNHRQKSAITVEDVLRSVGKIHENELRAADDAKILQVIEAYCASSWTQHSCRTLDSVKINSRVGQSILSPIETKTLLQHFLHPKKLGSSTSTSSSSCVHFLQHELNSPVTTTTAAAAMADTKLPRQSLPHSLLVSKSSLKRSESKNKSQTCLSRDSTVYRNQPSTSIITNTSSVSNTIPGSTINSSISSQPSQLSNYKQTTQGGCGGESIIQTFSPPPVVLPTRSGRR
ncbi:unnamed protein product [Heterobilharzia americana]|nr:unnamed protein product [Heterobilharzia americana]